MESNLKDSNAQTGNKQNQCHFEGGIFYVWIDTF